jgi:hypothetical protein
MQKITRLISAQKKVGNTLYRYEVTDELGNKQAVSSIQQYDIGEEVQVIWSKLSDKYNTPYLKKKA